MLRPYKNSHFVFMRPPVPYWFRRLNIPLCCPKQTFSGFVPPEASSTKIVPAGLLSSTWIALLSSCSASGVVRRHNFAFGSKIILLNWHLERKKIPFWNVNSIYWSLRLRENTFLSTADGSWSHRYKAHICRRSGYCQTLNISSLDIFQKTSALSHCSLQWPFTIQ